MSSTNQDGWTNYFTTGQALPAPSSDTCFVMGNGPSLGWLTEQEKARISECDSFAFNHYPKHRDAVGVEPTHFILIDSHDPTPEVLGDLPVLMRDDRFWSDTNLFLSSFWAERFEGFSNPVYCVPESRWPGPGQDPQLIRAYWRPYYRWGMLIDALRFRLLEKRSGSPMPDSRLRYFWAFRLSQRPLLTQGTLSLVLNLVWLMGYRRVHLVGVDLSDGQHFYKNDERVDDYDRRFTNIDPKKEHSTAVWGANNKTPPIQYILGSICRLYKQTGREIWIANPDSLPATCGAVPYRPIVTE
ncbi:MAG: hypothetical protein AAGI68_04095 [Planctomycetota bacterium]